MKSLYKAISRWNANYDSYGKLQHAYSGIVLVSLLMAGIVGLINYSLGQSILFISLVAILILVANGIVWALLNTFIVSKIPPQGTRKK